MFWDQIAANCRRLTAKLTFPRNDQLEPDARGDVKVNARSGDDSDDDTRPTPYLPDYHEVRSDSSLHTSS